MGTLCCHTNMLDLLETNTPAYFAEAFVRREKILSLTFALQVRIPSIEVTPLGQALALPTNIRLIRGKHSSLYYCSIRDRDKNLRINIWVRPEERSKRLEQALAFPTNVSHARVKTLQLILLHNQRRTSLLAQCHLGRLWHYQKTLNTQRTNTLAYFAAASVMNKKSKS